MALGWHFTQVYTGVCVRPLILSVCVWVVWEAGELQRALSLLRLQPLLTKL